MLGSTALQLGWAGFGRGSLSRRSPWPSTSAMLRVMMECTSLMSSLSLAMLRCVRVSRYNFFVFEMYVSALQQSKGLTSDIRQKHRHRLRQTIYRRM